MNIAILLHDRMTALDAIGPAQVLAGLGGAILGLSTLSFYGRPQDYLANIAVGFAVGIIAGTVYVTYKAASEPRSFYSVHGGTEPAIFDIGSVHGSVHREHLTLLDVNEKPAPQLVMRWELP